MDGFGQIGKYLKKTSRNADLALKRARPPQRSRERIRDIFDSEDSFKASINTPETAFQVLLDFNFGKKLPSLECCGDCLCGITESYTSDSLIGSNLYVTTPYVPGSVVLYIDGTKATKGIDYFESDPTTKQLFIAVPGTTFVVSYVYTVGNCTEAECIDSDRFECLGYTFISGLATVFADRFDRSPILDSAGGCGQYVTSSGVKTKAFIGGGEAIFGSEWIRLGGPNNLVGESVEMLVGVNTDNMGAAPTGDANFTFHNAGIGIFPFSTFFRFIKASTTTMELRVQGVIRQYLFEDNPFSNIEITGFTYNSPLLSTIIPFSGGRYWFRMAQIEGYAMMKAWPQGTPEPAGAQLVIQLADSYAQFPPAATEIKREWITPAVQEIGIDVGGVESIMVGAGLDNGDWGINGMSQGVTGSFCSAFPVDDGPGYTRFQHCAVDTNTATANNNTEPTLSWGSSYPTFFPPTAEPANAGRVITYDQIVVGWDVRDGYPNGVRIKGQLVADVWDNTTANTVTVQVLKFNEGPLTMQGANGLTGGTVIGSYALPTDGTPVDVDIFIPATSLSSFLRWGLHVPNLEGFVRAQPFHYGGPLGTNNTGSVIRWYYLRAEGVQSVQCTTQPPCNNCDTTRCPEVVDNFDTDNATRGFGGTDFYRTPTKGLPVFYDRGTTSKVEFNDGVQTISFNASGNVNIEYANPFDCNFPSNASGSAYEALFDVNIHTPVGGTGLSRFFFGDLELRISTAGVITTSSFGITPSWTSTNVTANTWYSVRYRLEGTTVSLKTWLAGTPEPSTWSFTGTSNQINGFILAPNGVGAITSYSVDLRGLTISKVV